MLNFENRNISKRKNYYLCSDFNRYEPSRRRQSSTKIKIMNKIKKHATNLQASRVVPSQMKGEDVVNKPSAEINNSINFDTETDVFNSPWGAEKAYFFLYLLNETASDFNEGILEDSNIRRPIPHFKTVSSFLVWVQETNPKTVKALIREVALFLSRCFEGIMHPDNPENTEGLTYFYKGFTRYMNNNVEIDHGDEAEGILDSILEDKE